MFGYFFNASGRPPGTGIDAPLDDKGKTALHLAVEEGKIPEVDKLLRSGANVQARDKAGYTPLFFAVARQDERMISFLLSKGASFKTQNDAGESALAAAIAGGCTLDFLEKLKGMGALLGAIQEDGKTLLHLAAEKNATPQMIEYLISQRLPVNAQDKQNKTALHFAADNANAATMKKLLDAGADAILRDDHIQTPLHFAARHGHEEGVDLLLVRPRVRETINDFKSLNEGFTPLMEAADKNHAAILKKFSRIGGDVNLTDNQNRHSLFIAAERGHLESVRTLLFLGADAAQSPLCTSNRSSIVHWIGGDTHVYLHILHSLYRAGAPLNAQDGNGQTALHKACGALDKTKIEALLALGADPNIPSIFGKRPIDIVLDHHVYAGLDGDEILSLLLKHRARVEICQAPEARLSPLHMAAQQGRTQAVKTLLAYKAPVDTVSRDDEATTALQESARHGCLDAFKILLEAGADPDLRDNDKKTALHHAASGNNLDILDILLARPTAGIDARDAEGMTPLHIAARLERTAAAEKLLAHNADPNLFDAAGVTPLHQAALTNSNSIVSLLAPKVDINAQTLDEGLTALHIAARGNYQMLAARLLELGADPTLPAKNGLLAIHLALQQDGLNIVEAQVSALKALGVSFDHYRDRQGWTLLHYAATRDRPEMAALFVEAGCDVDARTDNGDTPLHIAVRTNQNLLADFLARKSKADISIVNGNGDTPLALAQRLGRAEIAEFLTIEETVRHETAKANDNAVLLKRIGKGPGI